ncbi:MAG TPA: PQQ-binding-like beta-propeller repeat protein, partial [Candidatus Polarisedimenticolia bacterium]|nr:PQQ-binding-like beta-propeller repeat protein [Candidatus Polarisedimenticolia bacterium]
MTPLQRHKTKAPLAPALVCGLAVLLALLAHVSPVVAVATQTWRQRERGDFDKGDLDKVSLSAGGEIRLSPRLDLLYEARQPYVWALAQDAKGLLFAAGGNEGEIDRVNPAGRGEVFYRVEEPEVHALAVDASGALYAGTAPGGRIYKISSDGKLVWSRPTGEKYVWALVFDRQGTLFAATGVEGRVLKIDAS